MTSLMLVAPIPALFFQIAPLDETMISLAQVLLGSMVVASVLALILLPCIFFVIHRQGESIG